MKSCCIWKFYLLLALSLLVNVVIADDHCSYFMDQLAGCRCGHHVIDCTDCSPACSLEYFPTSDKVFESVESIYIYGARFKILNSSHLHQFPNIVELQITNSRLEAITDDALQETPNIRHLDFYDNHLSIFPKIANLNKLQTIDIHGNSIESIDYEQVKGCSKLITLNVNYNNLKVLKNETFRDSCQLQTLNASRNEDLYMIEEGFFNEITIQTLDLSYTKISSLPLNGLRRTIKYLDLDGCKNIRTFPIAEGLLYDEILCTNKTFPFLQSIRFEYHAHCCLYSHYKPLTNYNAVPETSTTQCSRKRSISLKESKRSSTDHTCINLQDGTTVSNYMPADNEVYTLVAFCDLTTFCFENLCPNNCIAIESSGSGIPQEMSGIACIANEELSVSLSPSTQTVSSQDITSSIPMPTTTINIGVSNSITTTTVCWNGGSLITDLGAFSNSASSSDENCCTTIELLLAQSSTEHIMSSSMNVKQSSTVQSTIISTTSSPTNTSPPPITECNLYSDHDLKQLCIFCRDSDCELMGVSCDQFLPVCNAEKRRKRSLGCLTKDCRSSECSEFEDLCLAKRQKRNADISTTCSTCNSASGSKSYSTNVINIMPSVSFSLICSSGVLSTLGLPSTSFQSTLGLPSTSFQSSSSSMPSPTNSLPPPITKCDLYSGSELKELCIVCRDADCELMGVSCEQFLPVCNAEKRRKRSLDCVASSCRGIECKEFKHLCFGSRQKRNDISPLACGGCSVSIITSFSEITPTTTQYSYTQPSTQQSLLTNIATSTSTDALSRSVDSNIGTQSIAECTPNIRLLPVELYYERNSSIDCYPSNDPFNPCFHVLDDDILRASIWIVLLLAIFGNGIVIIVTLSHWMFKYKSHREGPDLLYVLYLNLAIADLFMGFYLITIASVDIDTKGHYFQKAIVWQTGPGCAFAGFCAILSSILSIYTLLIITTERVYSIKFALQRKRFKKHWVFLLMLFGWVLALLLAILPMVGLSSYDRVSICLPFENRETKDKVYIAFVLVITGLASFFIFFSYVYLFYIVGCSANKRLLKKSMSGKEEMKLALRMSLLIVTDFATWAPIALFGLTAAFGYPIINDIKAAKVLMVFVFPLNSCLNPILYSFSTRLFRNNVLNMLKKCGLHARCGQLNKSIRSSTTDKGMSLDSTNDSNGTGYNRRRRSTQMSILSRLASISSIGSIGEHNGSRRGSTFSGSSNEGLPAISVETRPNGLVSPRSLVKSSWDSTGSLTNTSRLKALPEENEIDVNHISLDLHRKNSAESNCSTSFTSSISPIGKLSNGSTRRQSLPTILDQDSPLHVSNRPNGLILTNKRVAYDDEIEVTVF